MKKIIARINKLMTLTSSSNKNESEKAAEMAFKLMEKNNISTSELKASNIGEIFTYFHLISLLS